MGLETSVSLLSISGNSLQKTEKASAGFSERQRPEQNRREQRAEKNIMTNVFLTVDKEVILPQTGAHCSASSATYSNRNKPGHIKKFSMVIKSTSNLVVLC